MPSTQSNLKLLPNLAFEAIGTHWSIETTEPLKEQIKRDIAKRIRAFDQTYSRFRDDSLVSLVSKKAGSYTFPADSLELVPFYDQLYKLTDGAVTPLVGDALVALGYDKSYSFKGEMPTTIDSWGKVVHWDGTTLSTKKPLTLDFGAAGKGYLVDEVAKILMSHNIREYTIDASGDIRIDGPAIQTIGLEDPRDATRIIGIAQLQGSSLCASATNRRRWKKHLHHVIDGRTNQPTENVIATWVIADSTMMADGLATALFFVTASRLQSVGDFQYVRMFKNGSIEYSRDFVGELYI